MPPGPNDLDLSLLPSEHRAAFEALQRRVDLLAEANQRQEVSMAAGNPATMAVQNPATEVCERTSVAGERLGACAPHIAGACQGAPARQGRLAAVMIRRSRLLFERGFG